MDTLFWMGKSCIFTILRLRYGLRSRSRTQHPRCAAGFPEDTPLATFNPHRFSHPETFAAVKRSRLVAFLTAFASFLEQRGLTLPSDSRGTLDLELLVQIVMTPGTDTPPAFIDALYYIHEMATPEGMDALLAEAEERDVTLEGDEDDSPLDVAIQVWLIEADLLREKHAEKHLSRPRSFEYYNTDRAVPDFKLPKASTLQALEQNLDEWFENKKRGRGARVFVYPKEDAVWFLVQHGEPFRREGSVDGRETGSVAYRPVKYDVLVYDPKSGELGVNAASVGEKKLYRAQVGKHLFGSEDFFPGDAKYTLDPLRDDGEASLDCDEIEGIEWIKLREVQFYWGGQYGEIEIRKASDVFAAYAARNRQLPSGGRLFKAVFQVKFEDCKSPRSVTIKTSNIAQYTRDHDSALIEQWLTARGFSISREASEHVKAEPLLAKA